MRVINSKLQRRKWFCAGLAHRFVISSTAALCVQHGRANLSCCVHSKVREELVDALNEGNESMRSLTKVLPQTDGDGGDLKRRRMFVLTQTRSGDESHAHPWPSSSKHKNGKSKIEMLRAKLKDAEGEYATKRCAHRHFSNITRHHFLLLMAAKRDSSN